MTLARCRSHQPSVVLDFIRKLSRTGKVIGAPEGPVTPPGNQGPASHHVSRAGARISRLEVSGLPGGPVVKIPVPGHEFNPRLGS